MLQLSQPRVRKYTFCSTHNKIHVLVFASKKVEKRFEPGWRQSIDAFHFQSEPEERVHF
jgi:hypothetical protein